MKIEGTTYAVNTHIIRNMQGSKSLRVYIGNQEVPYDNFTATLSWEQAKAIATEIMVGAAKLEYLEKWGVEKKELERE